MDDYSITFARSARKELEKLPGNVSERIITQIEKLSGNPRPPRSVKLKGSKSLWRIRIGDYRVIYSVDDASFVVDVSAVRHRRDAYFDL